jgi:hypothetical protein
MTLVQFVRTILKGRRMSLSDIQEAAAEQDLHFEHCAISACMAKLYRTGEVVRHQAPRRSHIGRRLVWVYAPSLTADWVAPPNERAGQRKRRHRAQMGELIQGLLADSTEPIPVSVAAKTVGATVMQAAYALRRLAQEGKAYPQIETQDTPTRYNTTVVMYRGGTTSQEYPAWLAPRATPTAKRRRVHRIKDE